MIKINSFTDCKEELDIEPLDVVKRVLGLIYKDICEPIGRLNEYWQGEIWVNTSLGTVNDHQPPWIYIDSRGDDYHAGFIPRSWGSGDCRHFSRERLTTSYRKIASQIQETLLEVYYGCFKWCPQCGGLSKIGLSCVKGKWGCPKKCINMQKEELDLFLQDIRSMTPDHCLKE